MSTVVIVEDDRTLASVVASYLERAGHDARPVHDGRAALDLVDEVEPDLVLLDVMLPELDGLTVCARVRERYPHVPVIMLTALGEVDDRIAGLEVGADDYVTKPFSPRELMLRVESVLRRTAAAPHATRTLRAGPIALDPAARRAFRDGQELNLTVREFDLLAYLLAHPGVAFSREQLMRVVWGWTFGDQSTVTVHVRRLREKVEDDPTRPRLIETVWGVGYRLTDGADATAAAGG
ncbi:MAG: response regulator transcription factor [Actinobacteria bacterium]|nr:response regulator transcription factor [Actinomycetota bacterium]